MENNRTYRNSSVIIAGIASIIIAISVIIRMVIDGFPIEQYNSVITWFGPAFGIATPILFGWIGLLLRSLTPRPKFWVKALVLLLVPGIYLMWTFLHGTGVYFWGDGDRCLWIYSAIFGFLIPVEHLENKNSESGWIELILFLGSAFCYCGINRVVNHFSVVNFQMLDSEWVRFFSRSMRFIPLAISIFFLADFSFSKTGQGLGEMKAIGKTVMILSILSFLITLIGLLQWGFYRMCLIKLYRLLSQPVAVYLIVVICRSLRAMIQSKGKVWSDLF